MSRTVAALLYIVLALSILTYCTALTKEKYRLEAANENNPGSTQATRTDDPAAGH